MHRTHAQAKNADSSNKNAYSFTYFFHATVGGLQHRPQVCTYACTAELLQAHVSMPCFRYQLIAMLLHRFEEIAHSWP